MRDNLITKVKAVKVKIVNNTVKYEIIEEPMVREFKVTIFINNLKYRTFIISPHMLEEFVLGNLASIGMITSSDDVAKLSYNNNKVNVYLKQMNDETLKILKNYIVGPSCGEILVNEEYIRKIPLNMKIPAKRIIESMRKLHESSKIFKITGGTHTVALLNTNDTTPLIVIEDIGRHNALDKIIGFGIKNEINFEKTILATSGRVSSDVMMKAIRAGIPIVISKSSATYEALQLARKANITLIGFARGMRFNIYSGTERILEIDSVGIALWDPI